MDDSLQKYLKNRPKWVQTLAVCLIRRDKIDSKVLAKLCYKEANNIKCNEFILVDKKTSLTKAASELSISIENISAPIGVNSLTSSSSLDFSKAPLTLIYGSNGSGKSSYARVLKSICGLNVDILPNIYKENAEEQSVYLTFKINGEKKSGKWDLNEDKASQLQKLSVFDAQIVDDYVDQQTPAATDPFEVRFLKKMNKEIDAVQAELKQGVDSLQSQLPNLPDVHRDTEVAGTYTSLDSDSEFNAIQQLIRWKKLDKKRKKLLEIALTEKDPLKLLSQKKKDLRAVAQLNMYWQGITDQTSQNNLKNIFKLKKKAHSKRIEAEKSAQALFNGTNVKGVGSGAWKNLWEAAREYSETEAYPDADFPHLNQDEDHCLLCHQLLDDTAISKFEDFENFVIGELESTAVAAEKSFQESYQGLPIIENSETWVVRFVLLNCDEKLISTAHSQLYKIQSKFDQATDKKELPVVKIKKISKVIVKKLAEIEESILTLEGLVESTNRIKLENELRELKAKEWVAAQESSIQNEIARLKKINLYENAIAKANTSSASRRIKEIVESQFINDYQERFRLELNNLGAERINIVPSGLHEGKGAVAFTLQLENAVSKHKNKDVLSDGERRVVALAAFLADMSMKGESLPFIFDDPVSSLDQDYEEKVAERLVELSKTRQVIVFTHRLSLKTLLTEGIKQVAKDARELGKEASTKCEVITLQRINSDVGIVTDSLISEKRLSGAFQNLLDRCRDLEKLDPAEEHQRYLEGLRLICTDFRTLVERCVEEKLLNNVVKRYRRSIMTKDKLLRLTRMTVDDARLLEGMMTKYSPFEHSQSMEAPVRPPELQDLKQDIEQLKTWEKGYLKLKANTQKGSK